MDSLDPDDVGYRGVMKSFTCNMDPRHLPPPRHVELATSRRDSFTEDSAAPGHPGRQTSASDAAAARAAAEAERNAQERAEAKAAAAAAVQLGISHWKRGVDGDEVRAA